MHCGISVAQLARNGSVHQQVSRAVVGFGYISGLWVIDRSVLLFPVC